MFLSWEDNNYCLGYSMDSVILRLIKQRFDTWKMIHK